MIKLMLDNDFVNDCGYAVSRDEYINSFNS